MQNAKELSRLIRELASAINQPCGIPELERVQNLLNKIRQTVCNSENIAPLLLEKVTSETDSANNLINTILKEQSADSRNVLEDISHKIASLQKLIDGHMVSTAPLTILAEDAPLVCDFITESYEHIESAEAGLLKLENSSGDAEAINLVFRAFHTIKGMAGFLNLSEIGSLAHSAENLLERIRKGTGQLTGANVDVVFESIDKMKKMLAMLKESLEAGKPVLPQTDLQELLIKLQSCAEGKLISAANGLTECKTDRKIEEAVAEQEHEHTNAESTIQAADEKMKVSMTRLDTLMDMIGELVIAQSMVNQQARAIFAPEHDLCRKVSHQGKIIREMQELSMSLRMVPISGLFKRMARLVRDLSRKSNKEIIFKTSGEDTELDRNMVDMISDPLVHMIRNCVDHGIEPAEIRRKAGKHPQGTIGLSAFHQGGIIVIQIMDDGRGLNTEKILERAIAAGFAQQGQQLSEQEIARLIFRPGLSTVEKITDVSGRGVGMDVVHKNIELLRGKIDIKSIPGKGATFSIHLPLTLAIIDGQIIRVGNQRYIIPIASIERNLSPKAEQISTVQGKGELVNIQGRLLPLIRLYELFQVKPSRVDILKCTLVVIEGDGKKCCLLVDELLGQQQVVIKGIGEGIGKIRGISGGAIMGDGNISLILDTRGIMQLAWEREVKNGR